MGVTKKLDCLESQYDVLYERTMISYMFEYQQLINLSHVVSSLIFVCYSIFVVIMIINDELFNVLLDTFNLRTQNYTSVENVCQEMGDTASRFIGIKKIQITKSF